MFSQALTGSLLGDSRAMTEGKGKVRTLANRDLRAYSFGYVHADSMFMSPKFPASTTLSTSHPGL